MSKSFFLFILLSFLFSNCNSEKKEIEIFEGYFSYMADANMFTSCNSSIVMPVNMDGAYLELEKKYLSISDGNGGRVYVRLKGKIEKVPPMEGDNLIDALVISEVVEINASKKCK